MHSHLPEAELLNGNSTRTRAPFGSVETDYVFGICNYTHIHGTFCPGRAAMVGFFAAYFVDVLTRLDMVGQTGNFICKAGLFFTVVGIILFRRKEDLENIQKLAEEATFYDQQWQASWQDQDLGTAGTSKQSGKK